MLVLTRKIGQSLVIGENIIVHVARGSGIQVALAIDAPRNIPVAQKEIWVRHNGRQGGSDRRGSAGMLAVQSESECEAGSEPSFIQEDNPHVESIAGQGTTSKAC
jgi:carbon storage regulator